MVILLLAIWLTRMPNLREEDKSLRFAETFRRLIRNRNYVWGVVAQFFYVGAQIAVWSFVIRYAMQQLHFDQIIAGLGDNVSTEYIIETLRGVEPVAAGFYNVCDWLGLDDLLPRTAEQAGATYYILSLMLFVVARFVCTGLMKYFSSRKILIALSALAVACCMIAVYGRGVAGVYALIGITGCMSLMFPTIYSFGLRGLGADTKIGGAGMIMAIAGAAVLTQIQGIVSDHAGGIEIAYWVPAIAFAIICYYGIFVCREEDHYGEKKVCDRG